MKKITSSHKLAQIVRAARRKRSRARWKRWKKRKLRSAYRHRIVINDGVKIERAWASSKQKMPANFCLDDNCEETIEFLSKLRAEIFTNASSSKVLTKPPNRHFSKKGPVKNINSYVDFSSIKNISTTAALVLAAYYDRRKHISGRRNSTVDEHLWNGNVVDVLVQVGFKEVLQLKTQESKVVRKGNIKILQFLTGERADGLFPGKLQESLLELLPETDKDQFLDIQPYNGILEAILNSHSWAYPDGHQWDFEPLKRWWITGSVDAGYGLVTVAAYDQGVSIPASLPRWEHYGRLQKMAARLAARTGLIGDLDSPRQDGMAIQLAMQIAKSATGLPQHGKGLHTMLEVAQRAAWGRLRILSRNGEYLWTTGAKATSRSHKHSIGGTLIEWRLRLR